MTDKTPIRVVLVDDHSKMHRIVQEILGAVSDIKLVGQGANGKEGILLCEQYQPDIALMDVVMPVMDGIETTKVLLTLLSNAIKATERGSSPPSAKN